MDIRQQATKARKDALRKVQSIGLHEAITLVATEGKFSGPGQYDGSVAWEECTVLGRRTKVVGGIERYTYEVNLNGELSLFLETQDGLISFHDGPWVGRLLAEAERQREAYAARKREGLLSEAKRTLENFSEVDY